MNLKFLASAALMLASAVASAVSEDASLVVAHPAHTLRGAVNAALKEDLDLQDTEHLSESPNKEEETVAIDGDLEKPKCPKWCWDPTFSGPRCRCNWKNGKWVRKGKGGKKKNCGKVCSNKGKKSKACKRCKKSVEDSIAYEEQASSSSSRSSDDEESYDFSDSEDYEDDDEEYVDEDGDENDYEHDIGNYGDGEYTEEDLDRPYCGGVKPPKKGCSKLITHSEKCKKVSENKDICHQERSCKWICTGNENTKQAEILAENSIEYDQETSSSSSSSGDDAESYSSSDSKDYDDDFERYDDDEGEFDIGDYEDSEDEGDDEYSMDMTLLQASPSDKEEEAAVIDGDFYKPKCPKRCWNAKGSGPRCGCVYKKGKWVRKPKMERKPCGRKPNSKCTKDFTIRKRCRMIGKKSCKKVKVCSWKCADDQNQGVVSI